MQVAGQQLLAAAPFTQQTSWPQHMDVSQGPRPLAVRVVAISGSRLYRVHFAIECTLLDCDGVPGSKDVPAVLSNRWSLAEALDENFFMTRVVRGQIRIAHCWDDCPDMHRSLCIPPLEQGFRRDAIRFETDGTGLAANYEILDRQVAVAAPYPATTISGYHTESMGEEKIGQWFSEARVRVTGPPNAWKHGLISRAFEACARRLNMLERKNTAKKNNWQLVSIVVTDEFADNVHAAQCYIKIRETEEGGDDNSSPVRYGWNSMTNRLGAEWKFYKYSDQKDEYDLSLHPVPPERGWAISAKTADGRDGAVELMLRCMGTDLCNSDPYAHQIGNAPKTKPAKQSQGETAPPTQATSATAALAASYWQTSSTAAQKRVYDTDVQVHVVGSLDSHLYSPPTLISDSAKQNVYTYCRMTSEFRLPQGKLALPVASPVTGKDSADSVAIVQIHKPTAFRIITCDVERIGDWPLAPDYPDTYTQQISGQKSSGTPLTGTLLHAELRPHPPIPTEDGTRALYRVYCRYVYALNRAPTNTEQLQIGASPLCKYKPSEASSAWNPANSLSSEVGP